MAEGQQRSGRVVSIGIAAWGIVEKNHELLGHNRDVPCHSISSPRLVSLIIKLSFFNKIDSLFHLGVNWLCLIIDMHIFSWSIMEHKENMVQR